MLKAERGNVEAGAQTNDTERLYLEYCVPRKIELNLAYAATANVWEDLKIIVRTLLLLGKAENRKQKAESRNWESRKQKPGKQK